MTVSTDASQDDLDRKQRERIHASRRLRDAFSLIVSRTDISLALRGELLERLERDVKISDLLNDITWHWPWFDLCYQTFKSLKKWPSEWSYLSESVPEPRCPVVGSCLALDRRAGNNGTPSFWKAAPWLTLIPC